MMPVAREIGFWIALTVAAAAVPLVAGDYVVGVGLVLSMWLALTQSWAVLSSMTGYVSLGHVVFYGLGSYIVIVTWQAIPLLAAIVAAGTASALFALVVGLQRRFAEAETISRADLPPDEAAANVAYLRQLLADRSDLRNPNRKVHLTSGPT